LASVNEDELARLFVDELSDYAIVVVDKADRIVTWNAGARVLLGYTADEAVGGSFSQLYARMDPLASETGASITSAAPLGRHETNRQLVRKDGIRFQANIVARPIADAENTVVGFGLILHDIDRSRRLAAAVPDLPAAPAAAMRGIARILVVDDNQGVLGIATDQLTSLGYSVIAATNGADALELLRQDDQIELLFTDVVMPGELAGRALAAKAMEIRPGLKVLFASGYFEDALVGKGQLAPDVQFLPKPYRKQELARKIEEVLSRL
jgi:PAS domain S-box-containing protein